MNEKNSLFSIIFLLIFLKFDSFGATPDYSLVCRKDYRVTSIKRTNSQFQKSVSGSLVVECEKIPITNLNQVFLIIFIYYVTINLGF